MIKVLTKLSKTELLLVFIVNILFFQMLIEKSLFYYNFNALIIGFITTTSLFINQYILYKVNPKFLPTSIVNAFTHILILYYELNTTLFALQSYNF